MQEIEKEMTFVDHLEALRWHLIRAVASILVFFFIAFSAKTYVFHYLILGPSRPDFITYQLMCRLGEYLNSPGLCISEITFTLQSRQMSAQFTMHLLVSLILGLVAAFPYAFWEIWRFIKPGLYPNEQKHSRGAVFFVSILFLIGVAFGYFIVAPLSINFLASYQVDPTIINEFDLSSYISTLTSLTLACGLMFELPVIVYFFTKAGILTPELMRLYRRHALVVIFIISAIITPPDVMSMMLIAFPLLLLYEVSIWVSAAIRKSDIKKLNKQTE
ncbi:MAG: twin-arginine translocase subunit TatC [Hymenobacteraceae bacterium]|nr:twin-arginine translocase subunit TatC [Hymenobacteraceae bacterium]MDX5396904.1 twin-arginine translocase subunit TatC [Hymenobacteraceae bacterium]MDX5442741.1 twin-arginine translocase subunit TatC [Hymenobacteraceae bacterium]MDX5512978.1 twin-arginine translocase subunit TatC [Hymenobacteraceae bacterium]